MKDTYHTLRLILGDQLNYQHSWYHSNSADTLYVCMEMRQETDYVGHHIQKILAFFASMRNFVHFLEEEGHEVTYLRLDDDRNTQSLTDNLEWLIAEYGIQRFEYQEPDEYRLHRQLETFCTHLSLPTQSYGTEHFLSEKEEFQGFYEGKKQYVMEHFYRYMRKKYDLLMDGENPIGEQWNFDGENRKKLPRSHVCPAPLLFSRSLGEIYTMVEEAGISYIGEVDPSDFIWPVSREESLRLLSFFLESCLENFGSYQDAMSEENWSIYHARISFSLNTKMLSPLEVVKAAITFWEERKEQISLAQIEGFVRQIIGWREYMRGIYWAHMPEYAKKNYFEHHRKLPDFFWTGETHMNCLKQAIRQSLQYSYAHHIQRLMVTGNFALLAGIAPDEVDRWYLGIYIDAIEWVEITNTRGMSQYADGGIVGTKPYVSSANYIHKMSDYCKGCVYDRKKKTGEGACPFNSLYWNFYDTHREKLASNPRIGMMYRAWEKMGTEDKAEIIKQANIYLDRIEDL